MRSMSAIIIIVYIVHVMLLIQFPESMRTLIFFATPALENFCVIWRYHRNKLLSQREVSGRI